MIHFQSNRLRLVLILICSFGQSSVEGAKRPNILFVMADDLGWMDLACQGNKLVDTPNIDRLASQGMRFTSAYAAAPVCSPTRAAVLTGQAPARVRMTSHLPGNFFPKDNRPQPANMLPAIESHHLTIAERLKEVGYANAFLGKWHIAPSVGPKGKVAAEHSPLNQGFDINIGGASYGGPPSFFSPYRISTLPDGKPGEYLPDRLVDETINFIRGNKSQPWMVHLWFYTVHWPMQAPDALLKKYKNRKGPGLNDTRYGAMIEAMDIAMGRLLDSLKAIGVDDETLVIFTSDNGGFAGVSDCRPLRESKGHLYEGGIRVPMIVRWPGQVNPGVVCHEPVVSMDFYPTFLDVAGLKPTGKPLDGESLVSLFKQTGKFKKRDLYFHFPNYAWHMDNRLGGAVRSGDYKMIRNYDDQSVELYDLKSDLSETKNLVNQQPQLANQLNIKLTEWLKETDALMPGPPNPREQ